MAGQAYEVLRIRYGTSPQRGLDAAERVGDGVALGRTERAGERGLRRGAHGVALTPELP